jgi:signal transduction histidine kinase
MKLMPEAIKHWTESSLSHKFLFGIAATLMVSSMIFLLLYLTMHRAQLQSERTQAVEDINLLLQTSLENAMLKRDLDGLRDIVSRLGQQDGILGVMITNPGGEVRFASDPAMLGHRYARETDPACRACHQRQNGPEDTTVFTENKHGHAILRSVLPVENKPACTACHGPIESHPVNGVLFVDYDALPIRRHAQQTTLFLMGSGAIVVFITLTGSWWFMRRFVLKPVRQLQQASRAMSEGNLHARVGLQGSDELGELGEAFNAMGERVEHSVQKLRQKDAFLQGVVDAIPDGIRVIDDSFRIVLANQAYREQLNVTEEEIGALCYQSSHKRDQACPPTLVTCPLHEILTHGKPLKVLDHFVNADGRPFPVEVVAAPMRLHDGSDTRTLIVESVRNLEEHIQFSQEQRLSELGRLAAGVAHEIHNPLTSIRLALDSIVKLGERTDRGLQPIWDYLEVMDSQIDACIGITERMLKLSMSPGQRQVVSVNDAVTEVISLVAWEAGTRQISIHEELDSANPRVIATESEIRAVILNLAQNAFHAMPNGGRLKVTTHKREGKIVLAVEDTGVGILPEDRQHIFEPFFSHRGDGVKGTGLGLSILMAIAKRYDGRVDVESRRGLGSRFSVVFPDADSDSEES